MTGANVLFHNYYLLQEIFADAHDVVFKAPPDLTVEWLEKYLAKVPESDAKLLAADPERKLSAEKMAKKLYPNNKNLSALQKFALESLLGDNKKLCLKKWEPASYPIIKINSPQDLNVISDIKALCSSINRPVPNMTRVMIPMTLTCGLTHNLPHLDFIEGLYLETPQDIQILFNGQALGIKPETSYVPLGMLPTYAAPYTDVSLHAIPGVTVYVIYHMSTALGDLLVKDHGTIFTCNVAGKKVQCINGAFSVRY